MAYSYQPTRVVSELVRNSQRPATRPRADLISLALGEPDFKTPEHIGRAFADAIAAGYTHYAEQRGDPELREALADVVTRAAGRDYAASDIVISHGGSGGLCAAIVATVDAGDRVVIPEPTYSLYADQVRLAGGTPVFVAPAPGPGFHPDLGRLATELPGARLLIICQPCNPTGAVYSRRELAEVARLARQHDVLVLADEAYDHIIYDGVDFTSTLQIPELADRLIYCQTFSKTYAMTGWRLGYLAAPTDIAAAAARVHYTLAGPMGTALQRAGLAALTTPPELTEAWRQEYQTRRGIVLDHLADIPGIEYSAPDGTFYVFVRYPQAMTALEMVQLATRYGIAVRPGTEFGPSGQGHIRIGFTLEREPLLDGLRRLRLLLTGAEAPGS